MRRYQPVAVICLPTCPSAPRLLPSVSFRVPFKPYLAAIWLVHFRSESNKAVYARRRRLDYVAVIKSIPAEFSRLQRMKSLSMTNGQPLMVSLPFLPLPLPSTLPRNLVTLELDHTQFSGEPSSTVACPSGCTSLV